MKRSKSLGPLFLIMLVISSSIMIFVFPSLSMDTQIYSEEETIRYTEILEKNLDLYYSLELSPSGVPEEEGAPLDYGGLIGSFRVTK